MFAKLTKRFCSPSQILKQEGQQVQNMASILDPSYIDGLYSKRSKPSTSTERAPTIRLRIESHILPITHLISLSHPANSYQ